MAFGLYLFSKPSGGGPAPLIYNPVSYLVGILQVLQVILCVLSCISFSFPSVADLFCPALQKNSDYCAVCAAVAFGTTAYLSVLAWRKWGTETEWAYASVVTMTVALVDLCTAGWGISVWVASSQAFFTENLSDDEDSGTCKHWKGFVLYSVTAGVITLHVTVAIFGSVVSVLLAKRVNLQLEEIRRLV